MLSEIFLFRPIESALFRGQMKTAFSYLAPLQSTSTIVFITPLQYPSFNCMYSYVSIGK